MKKALLRSWMSASLTVYWLLKPWDAWAYTYATFDKRALFQHWIRSVEEEPAEAKVQIFRPANSREFPSSRFRMAYAFSQKGACEFLFLAPNDGHYFKACRWTMSGRNPLVLRITAEGLTSAYNIVELSPSILKIVPVALQKK